MLPELRMPDELSGRLSAEVRRRCELTMRASSVAMYTHTARFAPRKESSLAEPTTTLFEDEKETILQLFAQECRGVLTALRERLGG